MSDTSTHAEDNFPGVAYENERDVMAERAAGLKENTIQYVNPNDVFSRMQAVGTAINLPGLTSVEDLLSAAETIRLYVVEGPTPGPTEAATEAPDDSQGVAGAPV